MPEAILAPSVYVFWPVPFWAQEDYRSLTKPEINFLIALRRLPGRPRSEPPALSSCRAANSVQERRHPVNSIGGRNTGSKSNGRNFKV